MTRAIRDRILKDANGDISDHLRNHIHLTNCIHLKNHMHKQSPILTDRSLMRDLLVLQRSRSLRDPSASPRSWHSPSIVDLLPRKGENDVMIREGRRSVDIERPRDSRRLSVSSPHLGCLHGSNFLHSEVGGVNDGIAVVSDRSSKSRVRTARRVRREESGHRSDRIGLGGENEEPRQGTDGDSLARDAVSAKSELKDQGSKERERRMSDADAKTLSEQLRNIHIESDGMASSNIHRNGRHSRQNNAGEEPNVGIHGYNTGRGRGKRRKFRGARRNRAALSQRDVEGHQSELSVASNTLAQSSANPMYQMEDRGATCGEKNVTEGPRNGCGIPWNWSSIHHRGKSILDMAGRSFTCGLSESRLRRGSTGRDGADLPVFSDRSSSSAKSDAEALPLLVEPSGSQGSSENAGWVHDYSGELGIFADRLLKHDVDSDIASEARSGDQRKSRGHTHNRHQNLTQKYTPRNFRDLVGQNLVAQALSNAVMRKKVGLLYVFYGPHGTGKTSCARIFARALNCHSMDHPKPCGLCDSCIAHDKGKSRNIKEIGPVSSFDFESIMDLLDNMTVSQLPSQYRVFIFDDCDTLSPDCWSTISKVIDRAPRRVVFVLICSSLDVLPHITISRCQKFFFPKLKDADIIYTLQWIATKEDLEIDKDALKLIASRSDGSLRDAEMTLEQLSLLGQKVTISLVQELVGLISDEKLVDLLDLALSADTVNTVKNLRVMMETGVEPLALMSQLATVITDILAGSYDFAKERSRRKFFRRFPLAKEDMEKLRQALKTLSEAEKQLRMSNDKLTWLTAALLQLAPDQQYMLPSSSADTSFNHSPLALNNAQGHGGMPHNGKGLSTSIAGIDRKRDAAVRTAPQQASATSTDMVLVRGRPSTGRNHKGSEEIWLEVLERIQSNAIKEFLFREGKLMSVTFGAAPTVQLLFSSHITKSTAEKFSSHILQAFESVLRSPVTIEIRCESKKDGRAAFEAPIMSTSRDGSFPMAANLASTSAVDNLSQILQGKSLERGRNEIVEIDASPRVPEGRDHGGKSFAPARRSSGSARDGDPEAPHKRLTTSTSGRKRIGELSQSLSLVKGKVSLAHVIQQAEGCPQRNGWSKRKAVSIAEKLEQENLRLEPRSRSLLCWKASRVTRRKLSRLKLRTRRPHSLLKLVSCGRCLSSKSPR